MISFIIAAPPVFKGFASHRIRRIVVYTGKCGAARIDGGSKCSYDFKGGAGLFQCIRSAVQCPVGFFLAPPAADGLDITG